MPKRYENPPIIEAICEFRFDPASSWDLAVPGLLYERVRATHPTRRQVMTIQVAVAAQKESVAESTIQAAARAQFVGSSEKDMIQVGENLLAINRLEPYSSWEEFSPFIRQAFDAYREVADPKGLVRVGLRYINRIVIPTARILMEDYFEFYPYLGRRLPQMHGPFLVSVQFPFEQDRDFLRLQLQSVVSPSPDVYWMLLDLDYFVTGQGKIEFQSVFEWLNRAHDRIEEVFEGCLKDSTRQLFRPIPQAS